MPNCCCVSYSEIKLTYWIDFESTSVTLEHITIDSCTSYSIGQIFFERGEFFTQIKESFLVNNNGMKGEADLRVQDAFYVNVYNTEFSNFSNHGDSAGLSTTISNKNSERSVEIGNV